MSEQPDPCSHAGCESWRDSDQQRPLQQVRPPRLIRRGSAVGAREHVSLGGGVHALYCADRRCSVPAGWRHVIVADQICRVPRIFSLLNCVYVAFDGRGGRRHNIPCAPSSWLLDLPHTQAHSLAASLAWAVLCITLDHPFPSCLLIIVALLFFCPLINYCL